MNESAPQTIPIILNLVAAIIGALGQWLYKKGGLLIGQVPIYKNWHLFAGMILFCGVMALFVVAFKMGGRMSVVYPVYATTFIWGTLIAINWDNEPWAWAQICGIGLITLGVAVIAIFSPN